MALLTPHPRRTLNALRQVAPSPPRRAPPTEPDLGTLALWLYTAPDRKAFTHALRRARTDDIGPTTAAAWLVLAAFHTGTATWGDVLDLAEDLGVAPPEHLPARSLDARFADTGAPREQLWEAVKRWLETCGDAPALGPAIDAYFQTIRTRRVAGEAPSSNATARPRPTTPATTTEGAARGTASTSPSGAAGPTRPSSPTSSSSTASPAGRNPVAELDALIRGHTTLHNRTQMLHQHRHREEIRQRIEDQLKRGNHPLIARAMIDLLPVHFVLEDFATRDQHMLALAETLHSREIAPAIRQQALIEGWGTNGAWRAHLPARADRLLNPDLRQRILTTREQLERGEGALEDDTRRDLIRRTWITEAVQLRIRAAHAQAHDADPRLIRPLYAQAITRAREARHESLEMSLLLDLARFELDAHRLQPAWRWTQDALALAIRKQNGRRHLMAQLEATRLLLRSGQPGFARTLLHQARALFDRLQSLPGDRGQLPDWYQPGLRGDLEQLAQLIRREGLDPGREDDE